MAKRTKGPITEPKKCSKCGEFKSAKEFHLDTRTGDRLLSWCRSCMSHKAREYRKRYPEKHKIHDKEYGLRKKYGITLEDYTIMLTAQNGVCKICGKVNSGGQMLAVDHDHMTGKIRGLLCSNCNSVLGYSKDDISILTKAINYLKEN